PATEPRRKWHLLRWTFVVFVVVFGWGGWRHYDFRQAVKEAEERGWTFNYDDPADVIRADWKAAFRKETWSGPQRDLYIRTGTVSERDVDLVRRLKPKRLQIDATFPWRDLSQLHGRSNLTALWLSDCPNLTNIDALKEMKELTYLLINCPALVNIDALKELKNLQRLVLTHGTALTNLNALRDMNGLEFISLFGCTGLTNVDVLHRLTGLKMLDLRGCTGLTTEAVDAVKAALAKTQIVSDYDK
ncbi:MAG: expression site-associated 8, partial [Verrucomicrobiota bacterium]